jgi:hypothetical protein
MGRRLAWFVGGFILSCNSYYLGDKLSNPGNSSGGYNQGDGSNYLRPIFMFRAPTTYNGDLRTAGGAADGRAGADTLCVGARGGFTFPDNSCNQVRAFISISAGDSISAMPTNYGVPTNRVIKGPTGTNIDNHWADLMVQPTLVALDAAGVLPASSNWWSFSANTANGAFDTGANCSGGMAGTSVNGAQGNASVNNTAWMNNGNVICSTTLYLLCLCY